MHACGHDVHTSILLGSAIIINKLKAYLEGSIKFIFQPAEEKLPGGASLMIKEGVLKNPNVEKMIALHVFPEMEVGNVGFRKGQYMAACDELKVEVIGKGGHAALTNKTINPITIASELILNTRQKVLDKKTLSPYVLEYGDFRALGASNIIPERAFIEGTLRTMDEKFRQEVHEILLEEALKIEKKYRAICIFNIKKGYPSLFNNPDLTDHCIQLCSDILNENNIHNLPIRMASEDFSFFSQECPSSFFRLGVANSNKGITHLVHTSKFDIDHEAIRIGLNLMSYFAFKI
jgi:amidohydrolase